MLGMISILIGTLIVVASVLLIRNEFQRAIRMRNTQFSGLSDANVQQVLRYLEKVEGTIDDLNQAFYDITEDLEGKYSVHEKQITDIERYIMEYHKGQKNGVYETIQAHSSAEVTAHQGEDDQASVQEELPKGPLSLTDKAHLKLKEGKPMQQVAKELHMGIRELELMLKTRK